MSIRRLASFAAALAIVAGVATLALPTPARATPRPRCLVEPGDPGCPPCTVWSNHLCRCVKIPSCKL